jgi:predicted nucleic acid-binding protein
VASSGATVLLTFNDLRLRLADAVQAASALAINAAALVTHDRDFSRVNTLRVIS